MTHLSAQIVFLMYHELELGGRTLCQSEPGYVRYILPVESLREQMKWLSESGFRGVNVSQALAYPAEPCVCITFDDGCETDLIAAVPILREFGFHATFYVTAGFLGTPGFLTAEQLRQLDSDGFEIGCHSMTHPYLSDISEPELKREIVDAKIRIEQILGHPIKHFSCPGGRYDDRVLAMGDRAGFKTIANSDFHANSRETNVNQLGRIPMMRGLPLSDFGMICSARGLWKRRLQQQTRRGLQRMLGNQAYDNLRETLLGRN